MREGDAAVEPLLAVLESDNRLTRDASLPSVSFNGQEPRFIRYVDQLAREALVAILKTRDVPGLSRPDRGRDPTARRRDAAAFRAVWEATRGLPKR